MKYLQIKFIQIALLVLFFSLQSNAQISKAAIRATGLTCSMCSNAINKQLKTLPDVVKIDTDLNTNTFIVTLKNGNTLSPIVFKQKVEKAGFYIGSLVLTTQAETINKKAYVAVNKIANTKNEIQIQVLDKGYVTQKEFKKLSKLYKNVATYAVNNENDFHIRSLK